MRVLAIETSCDETGVALVEGRLAHRSTAEGHEGGRFEFTVLKAALLSQAALHAPYGGVFPNLAKREHQKNLPVLFKEFEGAEIDAIVVTSGPGLEPALWTGITFAQELAARLNKPLFAANHMEAHLISSLCERSGNHSSILQNTRMPVLALLISGGHTEFVHMRDWFDYQVIGQTLDDAIGEAFDKVARMLDLPYPGGPEISRLADTWRKERKEKQGSEGVARATARSTSGDLSADKSPYPKNSGFSWNLPRPMITSGTCDVSFSGLKTAALYALKDKKLTDDEKAAFAAEFEDAVADVFVAKTRQALRATGAQTFVIGGGVAANRYIRERLEQLIGEEYPDVEFRLPHLSITGDNAIMIAEAALCHLLTNDWHEPPAEIKASGQLSIAAK